MRLVAKFVSLTRVEHHNTDDHEVDQDRTGTLSELC